MTMSQEKRRFLDSNSATPTFIGANSVFVGNIRGVGQFVVSGEVHGDGELEGALIRLVAHSSLIGAEITLPYAQQVLKNFIDSQARKVTIESIQKMVAEQFGLRLVEIKADTDVEVRGGKACQRLPNPVQSGTQGTAPARIGSSPSSGLNASSGMPAFSFVRSSRPTNESPQRMR